MQEEPWKGILLPQRTRKINESGHRYPRTLHTTIIADRRICSYAFDARRCITDPWLFVADCDVRSGDGMDGLIGNRRRELRLDNA